MSLLIRPPQPVGRHVRIDLRCRQRGMPEHLLHTTQVGAALQKMGGSRMPKTMWREIGRVLDRGDPGVHEPANRSLIDSAASRSEKQGGTTATAHQRWPSVRQPNVQRPLRRRAVRYRPLLPTLAEDPNDPSVPIEIVDVETAQLADPDAGCIEQLHDRRIANGHGTTVVGGDSRLIEHGTRVGLSQHTRKRTVRFRAAEQRSGIGRHPTSSMCPGSEHPCRGRPPGHRAASFPEAVLLRQPRTQYSNIQPGEAIATVSLQVEEQIRDVTQVRADRMTAQIALRNEMPLVVTEHHGERLGELRRIRFLDRMIGGVHLLTMRQLPSTRQLATRDVYIE
jgi:hypothetical protein